MGKVQSVVPWGVITDPWHVSQHVPQNSVLDELPDAVRYGSRISRTYCVRFTGEEWKENSREIYRIYFVDAVRGEVSVGDWRIMEDKQGVTFTVHMTAYRQQVEFVVQVGTKWTATWHLAKDYRVIDMQLLIEPPVPDSPPDLEELADHRINPDHQDVLFLNVAGEEITTFDVVWDRYAYKTPLRDETSVSLSHIYPVPPEDDPLSVELVDWEFLNDYSGIRVRIKNTWANWNYQLNVDATYGDRTGGPNDGLTARHHIPITMKDPDRIQT